MRILIYSRAFAPMIGGLEKVVEILAGQFHTQGHDVCVVCQSADDGGRSFPYRVVRRPNLLQLMRLWRWSDIVLHANLSLRGIFPLPLVRRPWVVTHQSWFHTLGGPVGARARAKRWCTRLATNIACSQAVADSLGVPCQVISNPYDDGVFRQYGHCQRDHDVLFVGRLVSDKGANQLLDAVHLLGGRGIRPTVTITGSGPEETALRGQVARLGLSEQVRFTGSQSGIELARTMNEHHLLVVPSRWQEPFGIVALEGIACGCRLIGSSGGGLPEAIGPCGVVFRNGNVEQLADLIVQQLSQARTHDDIESARSSHLKRHSPSHVANAYLSVFNRMYRDHSTSWH